MSELLIIKDCIICSLSSNFKDMLDNFVQSNPSMHIELLYHNLHKLCVEHIETLTRQKMEYTDISLDHIKFHYNNCVFFRNNELYKDLRVLNELKNRLVLENDQSFTHKTANLLIKCIENKAKIVEKLPKRDVNVFDNIPTWS